MTSDVAENTNRNSGGIRNVEMKHFNFFESF